MKRDCKISVKGAVDWLEISVEGDWEKKARSNLSSLDLGMHTLAGKQVRIRKGGNDGPDFYDLAIQRSKLYRLHVYKTPVNDAALRVICFSNMTSHYGARRSRLIVRKFLKQLGFIWREEKVSRLDLCADLNVRFDSFRWHIDRKRYVCRAKSHNFKEHDTTLYFGKPKSVQAKIYDKAKQIGNNNPVTRIEFMVRRRWFRDNSVLQLKDVDLVELWKRLTTKWLRLTTDRPDGKHYDQLKVWRVWERIQRCDEFGPE